MMTEESTTFEWLTPSGLSSTEQKYLTASSTVLEDDQSATSTDLQSSSTETLATASEQTHNTLLFDSSTPEPSKRFLPSPTVTEENNCSTTETPAVSSEREHNMFQLNTSTIELTNHFRPSETNYQNVSLSLTSEETFTTRHLTATARPRQDKVVDHCLKAPCQNGGTCVVDGNTYKCICTAQFQGFDCELGRY